MGWRRSTLEAEELCRNPCCYRIHTVPQVKENMSWVHRQDGNQHCVFKLKRGSLPGKMRPVQRIQKGIFLAGYKDCCRHSLLQPKAGTGLRRASGEYNLRLAAAGNTKMSGCRPSGMTGHAILSTKYLVLSKPQNLSRKAIYLKRYFRLCATDGKWWAAIRRYLLKHREGHSNCSGTHVPDCSNLHQTCKLCFE